MPVLIGLLMLLGIVAKNSILLIDFAIEEMDHGVPKYEAIVDAGHKRAQPIVMTTVAMVAGMLPTAFSLHRRSLVARADGHHRDRRPDPLDRADPGASCRPASASRSASKSGWRRCSAALRAPTRRRTMPAPAPQPAE